MADSEFKLLFGRRSLVLGSGSPRRVALLTDMGISFTQIIPNVEEKLRPREEPFSYAQRLAKTKARWVIQRADPQQIVLGCDTIVVLDGLILGKPSNEREAYETLTTLSGRQHVVCTAAALADGVGLMTSGYETTKVYFNDVSREQIEEYIASGEPMDKAGAYGIQGMGAFLVDRIEGNLDNVIGLPRDLLNKLAERVNRIS
ncbi:MAG: Maf family protein [candidate division Zixibacteria bacterium]|nr:Maf family protein [candidate division Zixibacteria bacterium]